MEVDKDLLAGDHNANYNGDSNEAHTDKPPATQSDISCEELLQYVKERLDEYEQENTEKPTTPPTQRQRKFGNVTNKNVDKIRGAANKAFRPDRLYRLHSDLGPQKAARKALPVKSRSFYDTASSVDSEFDISGQTSANRYPWLRDQGVQCDLDWDNDSVFPSTPRLDRRAPRFRSQSLRSLNAGAVWVPTLSITEIALRRSVSPYPN